MNRVEARVGWWARVGRRVPGWVADAALGLLMGAGVLGRGLDEARSPVVPVAALLAAAGVGLWRRLPSAALALACGAGVLVTALRMAEPGLVAVGLTGYRVGVVSGRRTVLRSGVAAVVGLSAGVPLAEAAVGANSTEGPLLLIAVLTAALAGGNGVRGRRALEVARRERERRQAAEQRLHIARELHDSVGHHIAVINVQAGVASLHLRSRPEQAEEALEHVQHAARTVLGELTAVLGVLRDPDGRDTGEEPVRPPAGPADLERLVADARTAGMRVESSVSGEPRELPPAVGLSAYRVIQESLTNAGKHGSRHGVVRLRVSYRPDELCIDVQNRAARPPGRVNRAGESADSPSGYGLAGMAERVAAVGGTLHAGPRGGAEFVVLARLPTGGEESGG
ncbi:sensor histidine kinase [Streptomyces aculeolatus]